MNIERHWDMLAISWEAEPWDFELMFSFEPRRLGLPLACEFTRYGGVYDGYAARNHVLTVRILCAAIHFSFNRLSAAVAKGEG